MYVSFISYYYPELTFETFLYLYLIYTLYFAIIGLFDHQICKF